MQQASAESIMITRISNLFWVIAVSTILVAGHWWQRAHKFRDKLLQQWKPSLVIALLYMVSVIIGGTGIVPFYSIAIFCQAMIGLALAYSIIGYKPLLVTQAMSHQKKWTETFFLFLSGVLVITIIALVVNGSLGSILLQIFGEPAGNPRGIASLFPQNVWKSFFLMLAGAGIFEETLFRLVGVSLLLRLSHRPWVAIIVSALLFGAYHLSPLDSAYLQYWERPLTTFSLSTVMGVIMGYGYQKYGYETMVLGHTLGNWVSLLLSGMG
jgi:membrane protease YdiL (CAAX protease family)